jgi:predicted nucleotidyltransferase
VIIFGSYLEGLATEESDIDVLVISDEFAGLNEDNRLDILDAAAEGIVPEIHPWGFTSDELKKAHRLTTLGYAREKGVRFQEI